MWLQGHSVQHFGVWDHVHLCHELRGGAAEIGRTQLGLWHGQYQLVRLPLSVASMPLVRRLAQVPARKGASAVLRADILISLHVLLQLLLIDHPLLLLQLLELLLTAN